jgi:hypothetical protein
MELSQNDSFGHQKSKSQNETLSIIDQKIKQKSLKIILPLNLATKSLNQANSMTEHFQAVPQMQGLDERTAASIFKN